MQHISRYFISISLLFFIFQTSSQEKAKYSIAKNTIREVDSIVYKQPYGLRIGVDISKPILHQFNDKYNGLEFVTDYRISKRVYVAAEFGFEEEKSNEDFTNSTAIGSYARVGVNYNQFNNWLDMNNELFTGFRYGYARFKQTLHSYTPNVTDAQNGIYFPIQEVFVDETTEGLNAHWLELVIGVKVEVYHNLFLSLSGAYKIMVNVSDPENFTSLFSPGFNRIFESNTGFGFNYSISYLIPLKKK